MAARCFWTSGSSASQSCRSPAIPEFHKIILFSSSQFSSSSSSSSSSYHHLPILTSDSGSRFTGGCRNPNPYPHLRCLFAQLPSQSDPPPDKEPLTLRGLVEGISGFQERVQIFFAVFVWMCLLFWYSGRNTGGGRKGFRI